MCVLILLFGCKKEPPKPKPCDPIIVSETIYNEEFKKKFDSIMPLFSKLQAENDSLKAVNNILANKLLSSNLMIENARYYVNITIKNPSQDIFLKGWMRRALEIE